MIFCSICSSDYDLQGNVQFFATAGSDYGSFTRRVSRSTTLDGGTIITDNGFTALDKTIIVKARPNQSQFALLDYLCRNRPTLTLSIPGMCVLATCENFALTDDLLTLQFIPIQVLSA